MSSDCFAAPIKAVSRAITESADCSPSARKKTDRLSTGDKAMTELEEGTFDGEKENGRCGVNQHLDGHQGESGRERNVVNRTELSDKMDHEFLNQVSTVSDAGYEGDAGNSYSVKGQARAHSG